MNNIFNVILFLLSVAVGYMSCVYLNGRTLLIGVFISGLIFGIYLMNLKVKSKNMKLNLYKRELEKEAVSSDEASARVKVLESKIEVLEKALESALNK